MAEITASMVKELRERTDAPMMDCKKALSEAEGDMTRAEEILRVRFGNKASKAAGRVAAEGTVGINISADGKVGALVEVNSETDFCAKNEDFLKFVNELAAVIAASSASDVAAVSALPMSGATVEETRAQLVGKIGENITIRRFVRPAVQGKLASYVHGSKIGVILDLVGGDDALAKDLAMHIAAAKPKSLDASGVDASLIEAERRVAIEKAKEAGKPDSMLEKIADGTVQKFLKEVTLLSQAFVKDDKMTIEQLLKSKGASVASFTMYTVGQIIRLWVASTDYSGEMTI
ncbi:MAG TPA: translation elongation factor Ts, partial [Methylotenera sp.]|nr:translation elongation factor Ts [Methylotenera sp.]